LWAGLEGETRKKRKTNVQTMMGREERERRKEKVVISEVTTEVTRETMMETTLEATMEATMEMMKEIMKETSKKIWMMERTMGT